jgi:hypothetical protein
LIGDFAEIAAAGAGRVPTARESFIVSVFLGVSGCPPRPWRSIFGVQRHGGTLVAERGNHLAPGPRLHSAAVRHRACRGSLLAFSAAGERIGFGGISIWPVDLYMDRVAIGDSPGRDAFSDGSFRVGSIVRHQDCRQRKQRYDYAPPHSIPLFPKTRALVLNCTIAPTFAEPIIGGESISRYHHRIDL